MTKRILIRLGISIFILVGVSIVIFIAASFLPGEPAQHEPIVQQYLGWVTGVFTGDFGTSISTGGPVTELLGQTIANSLVLFIATVIIAIPAGILIGIYSALHRGTKRATGITWSAHILAAVPEFILGIVLITLFATTVLQILPAVAFSPDGSRIWQDPLQLILPVLTLVLVTAAHLAMRTQAAIIGVLESDFVEMARLKGVPENQVMRRHALPHAIGPIAKATAVQFAWLVGGVVVVEYLFSYPGLGHALVAAVTNRDVQVVQAICLVVAFSYVLITLLAEITSIMTNPRLRSAA